MTSATQPNSLVRIFLLTWLWSTFAGFYLVAYAFWVPALFSSPLIVAPLVAFTVALGLGLLYDGFGAALSLGARPPRALPGRRLWRVAGGLVLLAYLPVYLPASGRVVPHWPLDMAITLLSGIVMVAYAAADK